MSSTMQAIVYTEYGPLDVLRLQAVEKPVPANDEILVKVHAAGVTYADVSLVKGEPLLMRLVYGFPRPKHTRPGKEVAGYVEAVGKDVTQFKPGDAVFGDIYEHGRGSFGEYIAAPEHVFVHKPDNISFTEAAAVPETALVALQGLRKGNIQAGQKVLVVGASGGIGSFAVQLAKVFDTEVTAVCSTRNIELVRSLGADHVIDYTQEDFAESGQQFDLIIATIGYRKLADYQRVLSPTGTYVATGGDLKQIFQPMLFGSFVASKGQTMTNVSHQTSQADMQYIADLLAAGKIKVAIDREYPLAETADALRYYDTGKTQGNIVITVAQ